MLSHVPSAVLFQRRESPPCGGGSSITVQQCCHEYGVCCARPILTRRMLLVSGMYVGTMNIPITVPRSFVAFTLKLNSASAFYAAQRSCDKQAVATSAYAFHPAVHTLMPIAQKVQSTCSVLPAPVHAARRFSSNFANRLRCTSST